MTLAEALAAGVDRLAVFFVAGLARAVPVFALRAVPPLFFGAAFDFFGAAFVFFGAAFVFFEAAFAFFEAAFVFEGAFVFFEGAFVFFEAAFAFFEGAFVFFTTAFVFFEAARVDDLVFPAAALAFFTVFFAADFLPEVFLGADAAFFVDFRLDDFFAAFALAFALGEMGAFRAAVCAVPRGADETREFTRAEGDAVPRVSAKA